MITKEILQEVVEKLEKAPIKKADRCVYNISVKRDVPYSKLAESVKAYLRMTPAQYVRNRNMTKVVFALAGKPDYVTPRKVARDYGYRDEESLRKRFEKAHGCLPERVELADWYTAWPHAGMAETHKKYSALRFGFLNCIGSISVAGVMERYGCDDVFWDPSGPRPDFIECPGGMLQRTYSGDDFGLRNEWVLPSYAYPSLPWLMVQPETLYAEDLQQHKQELEDLILFGTGYEAAPHPIISVYMSEEGNQLWIPLRKIPFTKAQAG